MEELRKRFQSGRSAANLERSWRMGRGPLAESHLLQFRPLLQGVVSIGVGKPFAANSGGLRHIIDGG